MRVFAYTLAACDGEGRSQRYNALNYAKRTPGLSTIHAFHDDEGVDASIPLGQRPAGRELLDALRPRDALVVASLAVLGLPEHVEPLLREMATGDVTLHVLDLPAPLSPGVTRLVLDLDFFRRPPTPSAPADAVEISADDSATPESPPLETTAATIP